MVLGKHFFGLLELVPNIVYLLQVTVAEAIQLRVGVEHGRSSANQQQIQVLETLYDDVLVEDLICVNILNQIERPPTQVIDRLEFGVTD